MRNLELADIFDRNCLTYDDLLKLLHKCMPVFWAKTIWIMLCLQQQELTIAPG